MKLWSVLSVFFLQWIVGTFAIPMPKLPGLYSPSLCLPMTDHSYTGDPDGDLSQEVITTNWYQETLFCKRGCCGDSKEAMCCPPEKEEGLGTFQLVSIVAAGIAGVTFITLTSLYLIKSHNKQKRLVGDIASINKANNVKDAGKAGKAGQYQKGPDVMNSKKGGQLFKKNKTPPEMMRPRTPISILSGLTLGGPPLKPVKPPLQAPGANAFTEPSGKPAVEPQNDALIANLKSPSPPAVTSKPSVPAPSPPLPENLPPPLISPPFKTAHIDDDFIDSILASIPLEDTKMA